MNLLQYQYITVLRIYGRTAVLLVHGRGRIAVLPADTAGELHKSAMDIWNDCCDVSTW
jgi:hypothetical protein